VRNALQRRPHRADLGRRAARSAIAKGEAPFDEHRVTLPFVVRAIKHAAPGHAHGRRQGQDLYLFRQLVAGLVRGIDGRAGHHAAARAFPRHAGHRVGNRAQVRVDGRHRTRTRQGEDLRADPGQRHPEGTRADVHGPGRQRVAPLRRQARQHAPHELLPQRRRRIAHGLAEGLGQGAGIGPVQADQALAVAPDVDRRLRADALRLRHGRHREAAAGQQHRLAEQGRRQVAGRDGVRARVEIEAEAGQVDEHVIEGGRHGGLRQRIAIAAPEQCRRAVDAALRQQRPQQHDDLLDIAAALGQHGRRLARRGAIETHACADEADMAADPVRQRECACLPVRAPGRDLAREGAERRGGRGLAIQALADGGGEFRIACIAELQALTGVACPCRRTHQHK
jgi:hypothetical protein